MKILRWTLAAFGLLLATALLAVITFAFTLWWRPEIFLNELRARQALRWAPEGTLVSWSSFSWRFTHEAFLEKRSELALTDFCFKLGKSLSGCMPELRVDLSFSFSGLTPRMTRLGALKIHSTWIQAQIESGERKGEPLPDLRSPAFGAIVPKGMDLNKWGVVSIALQGVSLESAGNPPIAVDFMLKKSDHSPSFTARGSAARGKDFAFEFSGLGTLVPGALQWKGDISGNSGGWKLRTPVIFSWSDQVELKARPVLSNRNNKLSTPLHFLWKPESITADWGRLEFEKLWSGKRISLDRCQLTSTLDAEKGFPRKNELNCDLALLALQQGAILPPMRAKLNAMLELKPLDTNTVFAELRVSERGKNEYLGSELDLAASGRFSLEKNEVEGDPQIRFSASLKVPDLQNWKRALENTPLAVPAPFRILQGPLSLDLRMSKATGDELLLSVDLKSDLRGGRESLVTNSKAMVKVINPWRGKKAVEVDASAEFSDVALEAPPLRLEEPPQPLPDKRFLPSRISSLPGSQQAAIPLRWRLNLATKKPLRIRTNLLENEIPVALNLKLAHNSDMAGAVDILPMPVAVFKKKGEVKNMRITFRDGSSAGEVSGLIEHQNPEILIKILLLGSTESPRVEFESEPPFSRQQIVSVLLFNKSISDLTEDEASSAGSFSQATADGALGLFSLFFLSSTPVESISYDPIGQTYSARLRLGDKTTLAVGSDFDRERQVALRRRLGGRWAIRTELHDQEGRPDVLLTLLEWFNRF